MKNKNIDNSKQHERCIYIFTAFNFLRARKIFRHHPTIIFPKFDNGHFRGLESILRDLVCVYPLKIGKIITFDSTEEDHQD